MEDKKIYLAFAGVLLIVFLGFVLASPPTWTGTNVNYTTTEDSVYNHNLSANITGFHNDVIFDIDTSEGNDIYWTNSSGRNVVSESAISSFISITNSSSENLTVNSTYDNRTGFFEIPIQATNTSGGATTETFEFIINATNDAPSFTSVNTTYNMSEANPLSYFINATDEDSHYPLTFNVSFNATNCTHASWTPYSDNSDCSLYDFGFTLTSYPNLATLMSFTPNSSHVGTYWANISVWDDGADYSCPHSYCDTSTYETNKTIYYSQMVRFSVFSSLSVNVSDCQNKVFQEDTVGTCNVSIRTKEETDSLNVSTYALLRNYVAGQSGVSNTGWFHANESATASNFFYNVSINVTPSKTELGNWTINFTVDDDNGESSTQQIYVYVNRTTNDVPDLDTIVDKTTSINLETVINLTVYDDDLLVPDKNDSYGGFNETTRFNVTILNQSNLAQTLSITDFDVDILYMPISGSNITNAEIRFTPVSGDVGDYTINITVNDSEGSEDFETFNLSIISNSAPYWLNPNTTLTITEDNNIYLNLSENATDDDGDGLTFSYTVDNTFGSLNLTSAGLVNFTVNDSDVGQHLVNVTISDGYLTNFTVFNFTVYNTNDNVLIKYVGLSNATSNETSSDQAYAGSQVNASEDDYVSFFLWVEDDDLRVPIAQKSFYNETFSVNLTISGPNTNLFNFSINSDWWPQPGSNSIYPNRTMYEADFTPNKTDVGDYNITINVTDESNSSYQILFYLTVAEIDHNPVLTTTSNQTLAVNRTFYYDINVTDVEDGNDTSGTNTNFTFSYTNLTGNDIFASSFNSTTGLFNMTFNSSHGGLYRLNVTVNDSGGKEDSEVFWVIVYDAPSINSPASGYVFNLTENSTSVLNFTVNHSVADNLTYEFYVDSVVYDGNFSYGSLVLRNSDNYYGNGTSYNWSFTPNMTDETYGLQKNLTLIVYSNSSDLVNASLINTTRTFKLNISHANSPVSFDDNIDDQSGNYGTAITIDLYDHFSDDDYTDPYYQTALTFSASINTSSITSSVSGAGVLTLSATSAVTGSANVTASDSSTNATSNNFVISFTTPTTTSSSSTSSGGGGTTEVPVSLKIIVPYPISAFGGERIELPITLQNDGSSSLRGISLTATVAKDEKIFENINVTFTDDHIQTLGVGEEYNLTMFADINTNLAGTYEITLDADVDIPNYHDWAKIYITVKEGENVLEKLVFTEEFIANNPECIELTELVEEARVLLASGNPGAALEKSNEALKACQEAIKQPGKSRIAEIVEDKLYRYLIIGIVAGVFAGVIFYSYKRIKMAKRKKSVLQEIIKNKDYSFK